MSGIAGVLRTDQAPVHGDLIQRLTKFLAFRGPDALRVWTRGPVGFAHTLLRTTHEAECEHQPFTLDGHIWITADARVDARRDLIRELGEPADLHQAADVELVLRTYLRWGDTCVEHLLGDFAFAIWDDRTSRLFCARDHMGVKPFYYAHRDQWFVFSNTLNAVRLHPALSDRLNDDAIADFLLFGVNQDSSTTCFADINRLPPGHTLTCDKGGVLQVKRYWTLPVEDPIYYPDRRNYIEHFHELIRNAVSDRLRIRRVGIFMSGGLDSPGLAATAVGLLRTAPAVKGFTFVFDHLINDSERHYARLVATHLGIPVEFFSCDDDITGFPAGPPRTPEPASDMFDANAQLRHHARIADHSRVAFYGEGPDNALHYEWKPHVAWLRRQARPGRLLCDVVDHLRCHRSIPMLGRMRRFSRRRRTDNPADPVVPVWLDADFVKRVGFRDRWRGCLNKATPTHPVRPAGYASLRNPLWQAVFEGLEPPFTGVPLEVRHPYVDIRLLRFLLRVPAVPWCRNKYLLRSAFNGLLPKPVLNRPKTPLASNPDCVKADRQHLPPVLASSRIGAYGDPVRMRIGQYHDTSNFQIVQRFTALSYWLRNLDSNDDHQNTGEDHERAELTRIA